MSQPGESQNPSDNQIPDQNESRGQNVVHGTVTNGGMVFQGDNANVNITQNIFQNAHEPQEDLLVMEISKKFALEPETIPIPAGPFLMGAGNGEIKLLIEEYSVDENRVGNETPQHEVSLPAYRIGKHLVTNAEYQVFVDKAPDKSQILVNKSMGWYGLTVPDGLDEFPVAGITWYQALWYCQWLSEETGRNYQLPNEAQWEKACRGGNNFLFPWGDEFDPTRCNHGNSQIAPVDPSRREQNDYGVFDFVGNIRQWTCSLWGEKHMSPDSKYAYPWKDDRRNDLDANNEIRRVIRGGSFREDIGNLRCSLRNGQSPDQEVRSEVGIGFRVALIVDQN